MHLLQPSTCSCYQLKLPSLPSTSGSVSLDAPTRRRYTLECRTGAAVELTRSNIFVHGGLTIPLNLSQVNSVQIQKELILYFAKEKISGSSFKKLNDWISSETFYLDLITRTWKRVETTIEEGPKSEDEADDENLNPRFKERLHHSMCFAGTCLYIFGGLIVSPQSGYELIATNELWKLDLQAKQWSLVSKDPQITRRFTHSMHTLNEEDDSKDTKIIIAGGLNNIDKPINEIDIYNVTKNCWETELNNSSASKIISNIDGEKVPLLKESNYSILVENNEAKIPSLAFYAPEKDMPSEPGAKVTKPKKKKSPIVALPLLSDSQGMRMVCNQSQACSSLDMPFNLQFPTGDYFCYTIVMAGFYPTSQSSNFRCFVYDIPTGKWTRVGIVCNDGDIYKHRFWKLYVWHSHHQTLLLGTKNDDYCLPSVQKFDFLLSFGLPMISIYNKGMHSSIKQGVKLTAPVGQQTAYASASSSISSSPNCGESQEEGAFRKPSYASTATSQFESYIRYIAPPVEMTSIRSVFPPYAMVLGKDALEIFGNSLSDFEFITDEGDSIGVPLYLLRKRWGRYFDMLLSQGYVRACAEYENSGTPSEIIKFSPHSSQAISYSKKSEVSSTGSLDGYMNPNRSQQQKPISKPQEKGSLPDEETGEHPLSHLMSNSSTPSYFENDDEDPVSPPAISRADGGVNSHSTRSIHRIGTSSTTSSCGGMVFRVPFQETVPQALSDTNLPKPTAFEEKRRSSSVATAALDYLKPNHFAERWRRASHPNASISSPDDNRPRASSIRFVPTSSQSSRNPSITSQNSSLSYVSSSSDRMGNTATSSGMGSPFLGVLNVPLPPQSKMPNEPLPSVPHDLTSTTSKFNNSLLDLSLSARSSPFSSRRPSHDRRSSSSEVRRPSEQFQNSLDRQLMDETQTMDGSVDLTPNQHRSLFTRMNSKAGDQGNTSRISKNSDANRLSMSSYPESMESTNSALLEWEPLLTPRTLYMPWPTVTVRAFAEFFFTGQVNGKWMLAPVVLNLLIMSKIYEISLLYNLITEVLYSIVGRKEDSLYVICASLTNAFQNKVSNYCNNDQELIKSYLEGNELYAELLKVKESLENVDNGFFDMDLIKKVSKAFSSTTNRSSESGTDKFGTEESPFRTSLAGGGTVPIVFAGGPRDSHDSDRSLIYPASLNISPRQQPPNNNPNLKFKKKSSLSQEISPASFEEDAPLSSTHVSSDTALRNVEARILEEREGIAASDESTSSSSSGNEQEDRFGDEKYDTDEDYETTIIDARTGKSHDDDEEEEGEEYKKNIDELGSALPKDNSDASGSSQSESDGLNSDLGLLSLNKMKRKIAGQDDLDESIDPLFKIGTNFQSPSRECQPETKKFATKASSKDDMASYEPNSPTLENLASPNALPPVDYVIKSIYRTAALVNYPRLMVRCLDCIEISKRLRAIKRKLAAEFAKLEEDSKYFTHHEALKRQLLEKQKSDSALAKSMSTRPSPNQQAKQTSKAEKLRSNSAMPTEGRISPRTSLNRDEENSKVAGGSNQARKSLKAKYLNDNATPSSGTAVLMNPAIMPPPPPSSISRGKKTYSSPTAGAFSFFGKKK